VGWFWGLPPSLIVFRLGLDISGGNGSDISGGNGSDISGGNGSDISGGNGSDISGGTGSDNSGGDGTGVSKAFIQKLLSILSQAKACGSSCTVGNLQGVRQELINLQQSCTGGCSPRVAQKVDLTIKIVDKILYP